jgi:hypothetical protein
MQSTDWLNLALNSHAWLPPWKVGAREEKIVTRISLTTRFNTSYGQLPKTPSNLS